MSILDAFKSPTPPEPNQPIPSAPITPVTPAVAPKPATSSILDAFRTPTPSSQPQPTPSPVKTPQVKSPYFSAVDKSGNSLGFSDQTDVSGKPYFAYRNPGDTSTTTDKTRVATTFDPRVPQKLDPEVIQNGRLPESMSAPIKKELGGSYSDELDHTIALELSGSNDQSNLKVEPGIKGGESANFDKEENDLAHQVATGKVSLWDAQVKLASNKASKGDGNPVPWTAKAKSPGFWDDVKNAVGSLGKDAQDVIDKVKNTFLPQSAKAVTGPKTVTDLQNQILQDVPFTDKGKDIVNNQTKINLADPETHSAAANSQPGSPVGRSEINLRSADKPDDEKFLTHEFFNVIFSREKINPTAFNKAWQQAMKGTDENSSTLKRIDDELLNNADSASTYRNTDPNQENVTRDPEVLASERFASVGDTLGVDGISSIPKPLQSFYKAYLADTDQSKTPQPETEPTPQKNTTGSILDAFKGQNQDQVQPVTEHHYDLNNPDGLTKEQSYLGQVSTNISSQEKALSSAKVDHTDKAAVDAFNANVNSYKATVDAYNARSDAFNKAVEAYSKKNPPAPDENLKALEGQNATLSKANPTNVSQEQINQKDPFGALFVKAQNLNPDNTNIKIPFTTNRYVSIPALQVDPRVFGGNSTIKPLTTVTDLATNLPSQIVQAVPRAAVILKEEFTPDSLKGEKNKTLAPFEASLYGDATYKNTYADIQDRIRNGDGVLSAYIGGISAKVLDVAFGASVVASGFRVLSGLLAKSSPYSTIEAWKTLGSPANDVEATKNYQQLVKQFTPDNANPGGGNPEAFQTLQKARDILDKNGIPNTIKLYAQSSAQYAEWLGRETKLGDPIFNLNTKINGDGINPKPLGLKALSDGKTDDVVVDTPPKSVPQETLEASGASEINQNEENNSSQQEGVEVSSKPSNTVFKSGKIKSPSQEEMPILNKINAVIAGTSKTEVIAHTPSFLAQDNKERPLILSKGIVDKIQNDHGKIVPENLLQNANHWDAAIKNIKPQGGGAPGAEKINLLKKIPGTDNILVLAANRDNGFFTVSHYEIIPKKGNEIKSLLGRGSLLSPSGSPLAPKDFLTAPPAQGSSEGVLGNGGDGVSAGSRTQISNLEGLPSNPLTYKDNSTLPKTDNPVKSDKEKSPQSKTQSLNPGPKAPIAEIRNLLKTKFPDVNRNVIFDKSLLKNTGDHGQFYSKEDLITGQLRPIIRLYEKNGMAYVRTAYHELGHYLESLMPSWVIQQLDDETRAIMTPKDFRYYRDQGYKTETEQLSEFRQDNFGKEEADKSGHKSAWQKIADIIRDFLQKISDAAKAVYKKFYADIPNKQGGFIGNKAEYDAAEPSKEPEKGLSPMEQHLADLKTERDNLKENLDNHPAKSLSRYVNPRTGELPEALGTGRSKFGKVGDDLATELGFPDSETARQAYLGYKNLKGKVDQLTKDITNIKKVLTANRITAKDSKSLNSLLNKTADMTEQEVAKIASAKNRPEALQAKIEQRRQLAQQNLQDLLAATYKTTPPLVQNTLQHIGPLTEAAYDMTLAEHEKMLSDSSLPKIVIDTNTPVKKKVGILDYLRTPDRVLKKIGLQGVAAAIRRSYEGYLAELPLHIDLIRDWKGRVPADANKRIFRWLDGQNNRDFHSGKPTTPLVGEELKVAKEIRGYLKEWAARLGLPEDNQISHYITHIFGLGENEKEFDEELAKIIDKKVPGSVYDPFLEKRLGKKGYIEDTWKALDAYVKRAVRKANMDPALERLKDAASRVDVDTAKYLKRYGDRINLRPTEIDNLVDNTIKQMFGYRFGQRPTAYITRVARQTINRAMLGLNISSSLKFLTQGVNTYAKLGEKYTAIGYTKLLTQIGSKELEEQGILGQDFVQDKVLSGAGKMLERIDKGLFFMYKMADYVNRGSAYWGAKQQALDQGLSETAAQTVAKKFVRDTQFNFGSIDIPVGMNSDIAKVFTQMLSYGIKNAEFAGDIIKAKNWAAILRYIAASLVIVYGVGKVFNIKGTDMVPGYSVMNRLGTTPPMFNLPVEILKAVFNAPDQFGNIPTIAQKLTTVGKTALTSLVPAGLQAQKTYQGISTYANPSKNIVHNPYEATKAATLGSQNLDTKTTAFQATFDKIQQLIKAGKTDEAQAMVDKLSDKDYAQYQKMKKALTATTTKTNEKKMSPVVKQIQDLIAAGKQDEAQAIVDKMTDAEYHAYQLDKKKAGIQ